MHNRVMLSHISFEVYDNMSHIDNYIYKSTKDITFVECISMVFNAFDLIKHKDKFNNFYREFMMDYSIQEERGWPEIHFSKNIYGDRINILTTESFVDSGNLLMILSRLLYVECKKKVFAKKTSLDYDWTNKLLDFGKIINNTTFTHDSITKKLVVDLNLDEIIWLLKQHILQYKLTYSNPLIFENQLCTTIINSLNYT